MSGRWDCEPDETPTVLGGSPTLRWVTRRVIIRSERYKDQYGNWQPYDVVDQQRVLQQAVRINKGPGHKWVNVPEVEEHPHAHARQPAREATPKESGT